MTYYCRQHSYDIYHLSIKESVEDALEDFKKILGNVRFFLFIQDEYRIDGHFQCYYPRPIFEGDFRYEGYDLTEIKDARKETKIESFNINDIKNLKI